MGDGAESQSGDGLAAVRDRPRASIERATLVIPGTPKSFNQIGYRSHWAVGRAEKQRWEGFLGIALMEQGVPRKLKRVDAKATIRFKQKRRRDESNFRPLLDKALGDVLQSGWGLPDDTPDYFSFGAVTLFAPCPRPETIVVLDYVR